MFDFFKRYFTLAALVTTLNRLPPLHTFIMDLIYPEPVRRSHPFDRISYADLGLPTKNIPLITRGSSSYAMPVDTKKISQIDPANFTPSKVLSAADCNRFRSLGMGGQQQMVDNIIDSLRRTVRKSTEALAIQSLTGTIAYDIRNGDGAMDTYKVEFGSIKTIPIAKKWNDAGTKAGDVIASIGQIRENLQKTSEGSDIIHLINFDVYAALANLSGTLNNSDLIKVFPEYIQIGTDKFYLCSAQYFNHKEKTWVPAIPAKTVKSIARDDLFGLFYCALDSINADFAALPFAVNTVPLDDPEGMKFIGNSRPMPIPNVEAIRDSVVLT
jgi:hypothetical protein